MTASYTTTAPGKLILLGEYAVLFGGPAAVIAVDRRASVTLSPSPDGLWTVRATGLPASAARFELPADGRPCFRDTSKEDAHAYRLVIHIIRSLAGAGLLHPASARPARLELDTSAFFEATGRGPTKLGLGSSAALTVALASAVVRWSGRQDVLSPTNEWLTRLATIHREFQGGRGSGVDLAASLLGGALEYRVGEDGDPEVARPLRLPEGLHMLAVWTGRSADTGSFLRRLAERSAVDPNGIGRSMDRLAATSGRGLQALSSSRVGDFLDEVRRFCSDMEELGRRADMPILSAEHDRLVALTRPLGVAYKPSGAGGGDLGVCFSDSADALDAAASEVRSAGFEPIDLTIDQVGLA